MTIGPTGSAFYGSGDVPLTRYQVLGERSSGTNFVSRLIGRNTGLTPTDAYGWKHGFPQMLAVAPDTLIIGAVRDAFDWVRSMHTKPWHTRPALQALEFSDFLRAPWDTIIDRPRYFDGAKQLGLIGAPLQQDRSPDTGEMFENLLALRAAKARALLSFRNRGCRVLLVRMESVIADPEGFLASFAANTGAGLNTPYRPVMKRLGSRFKPASDVRPETPKTLSDADRAFIMSQLDPDLEAELGYVYA